jgi:predicted RNA polymerase sigma factor
VHRLELCEDAAQTALLRATQAWSSSLPDDPGAWLYRVAHNYVLDELRRARRDERYLAEVQSEYAQQEVQAALAAIEPPSWLLGYYLWDATLGELHRRRGDRQRALTHTKRALAAAPTNPEKALLQRRLNRIAVDGGAGGSHQP